MPKKSIKKSSVKTLPMIAMIAALGVSSFTYSVPVTADSSSPGVALTKSVRPYARKVRVKVSEIAIVHHEHSLKPIVAGVIQSIVGSTISIKDRDEKVYAVQTSSAKILKKGVIGQDPVSISLSDVKVGDMLGVQGILNGTNVIATRIITSPQHAFMQKINNKLKSVV